MVIMGYSCVLCVSAPVAALVNSSTSLPRASLDAVYEGHGVRPALSVRTRRRKILANRSSSPCRKELSHGVGRLTGVTVRASSADEPSGEKGQVKTEDVPAWAKPDSEELPPWAKNERPPSQEPAQDVPFPIYLIGSTLVSIAAVGSVFEYFNQNPVFGVVYPDNPLYTPILGFFAITGLPTAGFLFYKSIQLANKASEEADKEDGYRR